MHDFDQPDVIFDRAGVLKPEKDRRAARVARGVDVAAPIAPS
jgi:hypothetical protein